MAQAGAQNVNHAETLLLAVTEDGTVKLGLPPRDTLDNYPARAKNVGRLGSVSRVLCSPEGELFCVRDGDLYRGPRPSREAADWFSTAKRVGKSEWSKFHFLFFHPNGELYGEIKLRGFYKGPQPSNENISWMTEQATEIWPNEFTGPYYADDWISCNALFFHPSGDLYTVTQDHKLMKGKPPTTPQSHFQWCQTCTEVFSGDRLVNNHFISFCPDGKLWTVDKENGDLYRGSLLEYGGSILNREHLGSGYHQFRFLCFTKDKISHILSFQFLPERGAIGPGSPEVIEEQIYCNRSTSVLKRTFTINKPVKTSSSFSHEHGFTFEDGASLTFKAGIPEIAKTEATVHMNLSTNHNWWNFTETNETEVPFYHNSEVEVDPGKAIRVVASVVRAEMNVPYRARVKTLIGFETEIEGTWHGESVYNLMVNQEDFGN